MQYTAFVSRDGDNYLIEFPDCPGCQTFAESEVEVMAMAREALEGWLEATLAERRLPPIAQRHTKAPLGTSMLRVPINPVLSIAIQVRQARAQKGLSQGDLAGMIGVTQQAIAKLEDPDANPTLDTIRKAAEALGLEVRITLDSLSAFAQNSTVRSSAEHRIESKPEMSAVHPAEHLAATPAKKKATK
jgi:antitoxin HicB